MSPYPYATGVLARHEKNRRKAPAIAAAALTAALVAMQAEQWPQDSSGSGIGVVHYLYGPM
ncbi:MAG TPA: hypothetical protein VMQ86_11120 [Bryobacteraceae bacterium]|nr:hypothetical protein [Bryobacteraceae bacterium]